MQIDRRGPKAAPSAGRSTNKGCELVIQQTPVPSAEMPSALERFDAFAAALDGRRPAVFLDYDGTLTPIVGRPDLAVLEEPMRSAIRRLAMVCPVAVVSGRDLDDVAGMVGLPELVYAGSHGFDIRGPGLRTQVGLEYLTELQRAEMDLRARLSQVPGLLVERKRFAIAIHTRQVIPSIKAEVAAIVRSVAGELTQLRLTGGKEILELRPALEWDKGKAVLALLDSLRLAGPETVPVYIGDDETDEDAFRVLGGVGLGIRVTETRDATAADWCLHDPAEVGVFLTRLADWLAEA